MARHARLPASGAERWLNCPGSVRASEGLGSRSSSFAMEGTAAHYLAAECMKEAMDAEEFDGELIAIKDDEPEFFVDAEMREKAEASGWTVFEVDEEMAVGVQLYLDVCRGIAKGLHSTTEVRFETYLDMSWLHPALGGTADFMAAEPFGMLEIVDLKYGAGVVVEVLNNKQLKNYAVGCLRLYPDCERVGITVVQPRALHIDGPVRRVEFSRAELDEFQVELLEGARATERDDAPRNAGDWCRFCPAKARCEELRARVAVEAALDFDEQPSQLPTPGGNDDLARLLRWAPMIDALLRDAEGCALRELEAGRAVPGFKLVQGRSNRRWQFADDEIVRKVREADPKAETHEPAKLKSPAQMDKVGKAVKKVVATLTFKPPGRTTVASVTDPRDTLARGDVAALDFDDGPDPLA